MSYYQVSESQKAILYEEITKKEVKNVENEFEKKLSQMKEELNKRIEKINDYENKVFKIKSELLNSEDILNKNDNTIKTLLNNLNKLNSKRNAKEYPRIRHLLKNEKRNSDIILPENIINKYYLPDDIFMNIFQSSNNIELAFDDILQKASNDFIINKKVLLPSEIREDNKNILKTYFYFLLKNTFDSIEKCILSKKMNVILNNVKYPMILCDLCLKERAVFICNDCNELYCEKCKKMHLSNEMWKHHEIQKFDIPEIKNRNIIIKNSNIEEENENSEEDDEYDYVKMEEYVFPTQMTQNLGYDNLEEFFNQLYNEYITQNGILENNVISAKIYIQFKMEFVTKLQVVPEKTLEEAFDNIITHTPFNLLEIFIINRVCYKIFKFYGSKGKISQLFFTLRALQISNFDDRLKILLNILDIYDNNLIIKSELEKLLVFFSYQSYRDYLSINNILSSIYASDIDYVPLDKLYTFILTNITLKKLFEYLLQYEDENEEE